MNSRDVESDSYRFQNSEQKLRRRGSGSAKAQRQGSRYNENSNSPLNCFRQGESYPWLTLPAESERFSTTISSIGQHPAAYPAPVDVLADMSCEGVELSLDPFASIWADVAFRKARLDPTQECLARWRLVEHAMQVGPPDAARCIQHALDDLLTVNIDHEQR